MPHIKHISAGLWELRVTGRNQVRIIFIVERDVIVLLHAFFKKSEKIPSRDIKLAVKRGNIVVDRL